MFRLLPTVTLAPLNAAVPPSLPTLMASLALEEIFPQEELLFLTSVVKWMRAMAVVTTILGSVTQDQVYK